MRRWSPQARAGREMARPVLILGIETSCDETACAVVESGRIVRSSVVASQFDLHEKYGGVVPEIASRAHVERLLPVVRGALAQAGVTLGQIDAVAVGHRPGLIGSLLVGVAAAKALAWALGKSLVGVDHVHAHLYSGLLGAGEDELAGAFPALGLVVSGGHTSLYRCGSSVDVQRLGATIDDAMGEAFDKAASILGLPYPGGPNLDRLARTPGANPAAVKFPVSRLSPDSLDFSFSGLKTSLLYAVRGLPAPGGVFARDHTSLDEHRRADLAASFQAAAVQAAMVKLERALVRLRAEAVSPVALVTGGGVTANSHLRAELAAFATRRGLRLFLPAPEFCIDNAAMIAGLGYHLLQAGQIADLTLTASPTTAC
jgi:N6-L-threonylcarbamoyladenine synthase